MSMTETLKGKSTRDIEENKLDTAGDFHSMLHFSAEVWTLIFIGVGRGGAEKSWYNDTLGDRTGRNGGGGIPGPEKGAISMSFFYFKHFSF